MKEMENDVRAKVTLAMLELNTLVTKYFGSFADPKSACMVSAAVTHGEATGRPFGVSTISNLTGLSRRKVYDVLAGLEKDGVVCRSAQEGVPYPVYIRGGVCACGLTCAANPTIYKEIADIMKRVCAEENILPA